MRFTTRKLVLFGLILFFAVQFNHFLTLIVDPLLEPLYRFLTNEKGVRHEILSFNSQWLFLFIILSLLIIFFALFLEIVSSTSFPFIKRNLGTLIPRGITSTGIVKTGLMQIGFGLFAFHTFLLFDVLPILSNSSIQSEFLLLSSEVVIFGICLVFIAVLLESKILSGLEPKRRNLQQTTLNLLRNIRFMSKITLVGIIILCITLFLLEIGLLYQRFFKEDAWVIDPLLNVMDHTVRFLGYIINPILSLFGIGEIKPFFTPPKTPGDFTESEAALWRVLFRFMGEGAVLTLTTSLAALFFGLTIGTICGTISVTSHFPIPLIGRRLSTIFTSFLKAIIRIYVEWIRGTPLLAQIFFIWFAGATLIRSGIDFPFLGNLGDPNFVFDPISAGIIALTLNTGAYQTELIRSGIQAIPSGQLEAARSLGLTYSQGMSYVVLPQAFRLIIPPLTNEFISLLLNSSLLSVLSVFEMTRWARNLNNTTFRSPEVFAALMISYFAMTFVLSRIFRRVEERIRIPGFGVT